MIEVTSHPPSLWAATAEPGGDYPALSGREEADVAIVGGGFTGLSAALHLAEAVASDGGNVADRCALPGGGDCRVGRVAAKALKIALRPSAATLRGEFD